MIIYDDLYLLFPCWGCWSLQSRSRPSVLPRRFSRCQPPPGAFRDWQCTFLCLLHLEINEETKEWLNFRWNGNGKKVVAGWLYESRDVHATLRSNKSKSKVYKNKKRENSSISFVLSFSSNEEKFYSWTCYGTYFTLTYSHVRFSKSRGNNYVVCVTLVYRIQRGLYRSVPLTDLKSIYSNVSPVSPRKVNEAYTACCWIRNKCEAGGGAKQYK